MGKITVVQFEERYAMRQLDDMHKQGYTSVRGLVGFLRNEYRDITLFTAVKTINKWIYDRKIKHPKLVIVETKDGQKVEVSK